LWVVLAVVAGCGGDGSSGPDGQGDSGGRDAADAAETGVADVAADAPGPTDADASGAAGADGSAADADAASDHPGVSGDGPAGADASPDLVAESRATEADVADVADGPADQEAGANAAAVPAGLVGYWPMNADTVQGTVLKDVVGTTPGTLNGNITTSTGQVAGALTLTGTSAFIDFGNVLNDVLTAGTKSFSISMWVRPTPAAIAAEQVELLS
jgi:hypothetical protein